MSKEKQIEVITYEEDRLNYFTDLMNKAQKRYKRLFKKYKDAPYLSVESQMLSDAGRESHFHHDVVEMLEKGYRKQSEWISVDERLPESNGNYLCCMLWSNGASWFEILSFAKKLSEVSDCFDGKEHEGFYYFDPDWGDIETKEVTHWMPLPEAPKMKGGAE